MQSDLLFIFMSGLSTQWLLLPSLNPRDHFGPGCYLQLWDPGTRGGAAANESPALLPTRPFLKLECLSILAPNPIFPLAQSSTHIYLPSTSGSKAAKLSPLSPYPLPLPPKLLFWILVVIPHFSRALRPEPQRHPQLLLLPHPASPKAPSARAPPRPSFVSVLTNHCLSLVPWPWIGCKHPTLLSAGSFTGRLPCCQHSHGKYKERNNSQFLPSWSWWSAEGTEGHMSHRSYLHPAQSLTYCIKKNPTDQIPKAMMQIFTEGFTG